MRGYPPVCTRNEIFLRHQESVGFGVSHASFVTVSVAGLWYRSDYRLRICRTISYCSRNPRGVAYVGVKHYRRKSERNSAITVRSTLFPTEYLAKHTYGRCAIRFRKRFSTSTTIKSIALRSVPDPKPWLGVVVKPPLGTHPGGEEEKWRTTVSNIRSELLTRTEL